MSRSLFPLEASIFAGDAFSLDLVSYFCAQGQFISCLERESLTALCHADCIFSSTRLAIRNTSSSTYIFLAT
ncbi:unnamed protein product [Caretta caretta]